jgi:hypothetical protein
MRRHSGLKPRSRSGAKAHHLILFFSVLLSFELSFDLTVVAQNSNYSADSLMATFRKGSQPLKGTEITVVGTIAEIKKNEVTFRSSDNDKVICELTSTIDGSNKVGGPLTVVGKVRGRGLLGNVTLDQCHAAAVPDVASKQPPVAEPVPVQPQEVIVQPEEPAKLPVENAAAAAVATKAPAPVTATANAPNDYLPRRSPLGPTTKPASTVAKADEAATERPSLQAPAPCNPSKSDAAKETTSGFSSYTKAMPPGVFHAFAVMLVCIGAVLAFVKLRPSTGLRSSKNPTPEEMRRAALEALLKQKKG